MCSIINLAHAGTGPDPGFLDRGVDVAGHAHTANHARFTPAYDYNYKSSQQYYNNNYYVTVFILV